MRSPADTQKAIDAATLANLIEAVKVLQKDREEIAELIPFMEQDGDEDRVGESIEEIEAIDIVTASFNSMLRKARAKALNPDRHLLPDGDVPF